MGIIGSNIAKAGPCRSAWSSVMTGCAVLSLLAVALYWRASAYPYVEWDDGQYVADNALLAKAAKGEWLPLFVDPVMGNHHPVTMLSYAITEHYFGRSPSAHHMVSIGLHALNAALVLVFLSSLLRDRWLAFMAGLLWTVHPSHVENVAWVSARKDLLMLFFGMLATLAWMRWRMRGGWTAYAGILAGFALACASKATAVAFLPAWWLVDRWMGRPWRTSRELVAALPMVAIAIATGLLAIKAQHEVGTIANIKVDAATRALIGAANIAFYFIQHLFPLRLSVFYGYPAMSAGPPAHYWLMAGAAAAWVAWLTWGKARQTWLAFGFWLGLLLLLPVLQWLPVGEAVRADRYLYAPGVGFSICAAWGVARLAGRRGAAPWASLALVAAAIALAFAAHMRIPTWSDPLRIWDEMIADEPARYWHHMDRAVTLEKQGRMDEAYADFTAAVQKSPADLKPKYERAMLQIRRGRYREAMNDLLEVYQRKPSYPGLMANMLYAQLRLGMHQEVILNAGAIIQQMGETPDVLNIRASALLALDSLHAAGRDIQRSIALRSDYGEVWVLSALHHRLLGLTEEACADLARSRQYELADQLLVKEAAAMSAELHCP